MAIALAQGSNNNGTTASATPGSLTPTAGDLLILVVGLSVASGSPTIATPAGWTLVATVPVSATIVVAMFMLQNAAASATNPSSAIGGTTPHWAAQMFDFSGVGSSVANEALIGSATSTQSATALPNVFPATQMPQNNMLWCYSVGRVPANALTAANAGQQWSATQQAVATNFQLDFFWATNPGPGLFPTAGGTLAAGNPSSQIGAWFQTQLGNSIDYANIGGQAGVYVPGFFQGSIGG